MGLLRTLTPVLTDPTVALERARALLAADLWRLDLPSPEVFVGQDLGSAAVDTLLRARVRAPDLELTLCLPLSGDDVLPAEIVGRLNVPAPATAVLTPQGWVTHPDQVDDPVAGAFIDALNARPDLGMVLAWGPVDQTGPDWAIQVVSDAGDSCLLVVRTAPLGDHGQYAGMEAFLDVLPVMRDLMRHWSQQVALPVGVACDCLALHELSAGQLWEPNWHYEDTRVYTPDDLGEEDLDELPTELVYQPRVVNLAEVDLSEVVDGVLRDEDLSALTWDGPLVEIYDDEGFEDESSELASSEAEVGDEETCEDTCEEQGGLWLESVADDPTVDLLIDAEDQPDEEGVYAAVSEPVSEPVAQLSVAGPRPAPTLVALCSLVVPGLGQILCGQVAKGVAVLLLSVLTLGLGGLINIVMAADAWVVATRLREGRRVGKWRLFG